MIRAWSTGLKMGHGLVVYQTCKIVKSLVYLLDSVNNRNLLQFCKIQPRSPENVANPPTCSVTAVPQALWPLKCPRSASMFFFFRQVLEPQRRLMANRLHSVSAAWGCKELVQEVVGGERQYCVTMHIQGDALEAFLREILATWQSATLWSEVSCTETFRTNLLQLRIRLGSVLFWLVYVPTRGFRYRLFLLSPHYRTVRMNICRLANAC